LTADWQGRNNPLAMRSRADLAIATLRAAHQTFASNTRDVSLDEALQSAGGYRSILGLLKHTAGWSHVYHSYAFHEAPRHWAETDWPRGLRDTVDKSETYLKEVKAWYEASHAAWIASLRGLPDEALEEPKPCHWGTSAPLFDIVLMVADHWSYHAGEINHILSVVRGEAWELSEEVEENHISTAGHRVRPDWMTAEQAAGYEALLAKRDRELHPDGS
jgi:hypothetical protein